MKIFLNIFCMEAVILSANLALGQSSIEETLNLHIPISTDGREIRSSLSLKLYYQEPRKYITQYFEENSEASDLVLKNVIDSVINSDIELFNSNTFGAQEDIEEIYEQLQFINRQQAFDPNTASIIYKIYYGRNILYLLKTYFLNSERIVGFSIREIDNEHKYEAILPTPPLKDIIDTTIASVEILGRDFVDDGLDLTGISRFAFEDNYPVEISYINHWNINNDINSQQINDAVLNSPLAVSVIEFYREVIELLETGNVESVFNLMDETSKNRITGDSSDYLEQEMSNYLMNYLIPNYIVTLIDASPFLIVVGTNNISEYLEILNLTDKGQRMERLQDHNYMIRYLVNTNGALRMTHLRTQRFVDRLIESNMFREIVLVRAIENE